MIIIRYPQESSWTTITERPHIDISQLNNVVSEVLNDVKANGDDAVKRYEEKFDHASIRHLQVTENEMDEAEKTVSQELKNALHTASQTINKFHRAQTFHDIHLETLPGIDCWQRSVPIQRVGLYVPGGTAPLFSTVLMLAIPANIAGCKEIVLCSPPNHEGKIHPAILMAARIAGVKKIFKVGGVQAIGAMAYGTETVPKVYKIFGPGNQYVMAAKQQVSLHDVAIDMPAGPSEVCVVADHTAIPEFVASDLLSQAEHGADSQVLLITTSPQMLNKVEAEVKRQLTLLPRKEMALKALENSKLVLVNDLQEAMRLSNEYAPEHLILATEKPEELALQVSNAGSVFLGHYACESAGDYASGTNHTLPTHGYAKAYSGVNLDSFCRKITFQQLSEEGIRNIGKTVEIMAANEHLDAHKQAMSVRLIKSLDRP